MISEALSHSYFVNALMAAILVSISCGIMGSFIVAKKMSSISGGISHAALGGVGLGYYLGFSPVLGAIFVVLLASILIGKDYLKKEQGLDTMIAIVWSMGMAVGVLLMAMAPGAKPDLESYLFGSIIYVSREYIQWALILDCVVLFSVLAYFRRFQAIAFDEEFCHVHGIKVERLFYLLLTLISLVIVMLIQVVGVVMMIALLTIPAVVAKHWSYSLKSMMVYATGLALCSSVGGLFLSYYISYYYNNVPTGPVIILVAVLIYFISSSIYSLRQE